jgi:hypothetical protein
MSKTIRKVLLEKADSALLCLDRLDEYLMEMDNLHEGRQPAITTMAPILVEGHEQIRKLWKALKSQL